jgi:hypothetical protein
MCLEMGLHQREILEQKALADVQKEQLVRLFWSLYVLDNRWSIGTGLPSHLNADDIDPTLPRPVSSQLKDGLLKVQLLMPSRRDSPT